MIWIDEPAHGRFRKKLTNESCVEKLVETRLPTLVESLNKLGLTAYTGKHRPMRLPIDDESLKLLGNASHATQMPLTTLMRLVIS